MLLGAVAVLLLCAFELGRFGSELWRRRRARVYDLTAVARAAFAATVVGLLVGTAAFALTLLDSEDLAALERAVAPFAAPHASLPTPLAGGVA